MNNNIMLSVVIISYNQEKYITDAIESVLSQKTKYNYEIILADDCSPDNTLSIMKKYKQKYPCKINLLIRKKNMGGTSNSFDACMEAKGKYICILEGDDYWCNENKIENSIDFLENNKEYIGYSHLQEGISIDGKILGSFPKWIKKDTTVSMSDVLKRRNFSVTSTIFINIYKDSQCVNDFKKLLSFSKNVGDLQKMTYLLTKGKIFVKNEKNMRYRIIHSNNSSNYNSRYNVGEIAVEHLNIISQLDNFFNNKYSFKYLYCWFYTIGVSYYLLSLKVSCVKNVYNEVPKKFGKTVIINYPLFIGKYLFDRFIR